jgi:gamma-glutamyltranspeptidase/glutathione hydrolase
VTLGLPLSRLGWQSRLAGCFFGCAKLICMPAGYPPGVTSLPASVAAGHPSTSAVGRDVLARGGSAADAVAAMILAGCVSETLFTGLGGGGFATVYDAATGQVTCLDFFVAVPGLDGTKPAPARAIKVAFGDVEVPYAVGGPSVAVPGTPRGVAALHAKFGRLPWSDIVSPARDLAIAGTPFPLQHAELLPDVAAAMVLGAGVAVYSRPDGNGGRRTLAGGELLQHEGLSDTLDDYLNNGPDALTTGTRGRAFVQAVRADGGAMSDLDVADYRVQELPVERVDFGPGVICVRGNDLDAFGATASSMNAALHLTGPVERARSLVRALRAPALRAETTTVVAVDEQGNACAATHSLGLGSGIWTGGVHGNSMLGEGELLRGDLVPGQRMPSMMVPLMVTGRDGGLLFAGGAAGGSRIRPALLQVLTRVLIDGHGAAEAVAAPRLSATPEAVHLEPGFAPEVIAALADDGEELVQWPEQRPFFGGVAVVAKDGPAADPRRGGLALRLSP